MRPNPECTCSPTTKTFRSTTKQKVFSSLLLAMGKIPDRWLDYSRFGKPIEVAPIVAFKTPLSNRIEVDNRDRFTPQDLCRDLYDDGFELGVVIDLTNTFRYYNGNQELERRYNIQYEKIKCEGHVIPNDEVMGRVSDILNDFIDRNGLDSTYLVGIHCTHGVNRTGYIIARFLIESLGYNPEEAIRLVNEARGYAIERELYLKDLRTRKYLRDDERQSTNGNYPSNDEARVPNDKKVPNDVEQNHYTNAPIDTIPNDSNVSKTDETIQYSGDAMTLENEDGGISRNKPSNNKPNCDDSTIPSANDSHKPLESNGPTKLSCPTW